jgi:hypothetical protein
MNYRELLENTYNLGLSKKVQDKAKSKDAVENVSIIRFEDPEVEYICHEHGVYSVDDAAKVTSIYDWFAKNLVEGADIKKFNELKYFTGIQTLDETFNNCHNLEEVTLPNNLNTIGSFAFKDTSLSHIDIPESVTNIGFRAFCDCTLTEFVFPNNVKQIYAEVLSYCHDLKTIKFPLNVSLIDSEAFLGCDNLKTFIIDRNAPNIEYVKRKLRSRDMKLLDNITLKCI